MKKTNLDKIVLVIEDELPLQNAIRTKFEKHGFAVVTARSVEQAIGYLEDVANINIIWLDHYLIGGETGLDFVSKVKNNKKWSKIPIFVVSNTATADKVSSYLSLGVDKFCVKSDCRLENMILDMKKFLEGKCDKGE